MAFLVRSMSRSDNTPTYVVASYVYTYIYVGLLFLHPPFSINSSQQAGHLLSPLSFPKHTKAVAVVQLLAFSDSRHDNFIHVLSHSVHQIVAFRGDMAESSATYLFEGLFPSLSRYLSEKSRYVSNLDILNFVGKC